MRLIICPRCKEKNLPGRTSCKVCGFRLPESLPYDSGRQTETPQSSPPQTDEPENPSLTPCPACSHPCSLQADSCPACGHPLSKSAKERQADPAWLRRQIFLAGLLLIAVWFLIHGNVEVAVGLFIGWLIGGTVISNPIPRETEAGDTHNHSVQQRLLLIFALLIGTIAAVIFATSELGD
jgi:ribosomal protein L37E